MTVPVRLDHLVLATPELEPTVRWVAESLGVRPSPGGQHLGQGTRNFLLSLGPGHYLEVIGPDVDQPEPERPRSFGIDGLERPRLMAWVAKASTPLEEAVGAAARTGHDLGAIHARSRTTPAGKVLRWHATDMGAATVRVIPPLIDWGDTAHPSSTATAGARLIELTAVHPDPDRVRKVLDALGLELDVTAGAEARLIARIEGPRGALELS